MVQGITFDKQLLASEDFAHQVNYFYQGKMGVSKGCEVSANLDGNLVISDGYFSIYGRLLKNAGDTVADVPSVPSGTLYSSLVFEVDLTKENTIDQFNQGQFKIVSNSATYPALTQENLDDGGNIYQLEFARFENTVSGIVNLQDKRTILSMQMYALGGDLDRHLAESANMAHGGFKGALAILSNNQSILYNQEVSVSFNRTEYDTGQFFNPSAPTKLTIPHNVSKVIVKGQVCFAASSDDRFRFILVNKNDSIEFAGMPNVRISNSAQNNSMFINVVSPVLNVVEGDYFELKVRHQAPESLDIIGTSAGRTTWFSVEVVE